MPAAKPKTKADLDLPEDILDPQVAYFDALYPNRDKPATREEIRRAYSMFLVLELAPWIPVGQDKVVPLAADIEAYLKEGRVPGKGTDSAVTIHAVTDKGEILR